MTDISEIDNGVLTTSVLGAQVGGLRIAPGALAWLDQWRRGDDGPGEGGPHLPVELEDSGVGVCFGEVLRGESGRVLEEQTRTFLMAPTSVSSVPGGIAAAAYRSSHPSFSSISAFSSRTILTAPI